MGWQTGLLLGTVWGVCSFIRAFTSGSAISLLVFTNPLISIVPRALVGLLSGLLFVALQKVISSNHLRMSIVGAFGSLLNTTLVLSLIYFLIGNQYAEKLQKTLGELPVFFNDDCWNKWSSRSNCFCYYCTSCGWSSFKINGKTENEECLIKRK